MIYFILLFRHIDIILCSSNNSGLNAEENTSLNTNSRINLLSINNSNYSEDMFNIQNQCLNYISESSSNSNSSKSLEKNSIATLSSCSISSLNSSYNLILDIHDVLNKFMCLRFFFNKDFFLLESAKYTEMIINFIFDDLLETFPNKKDEKNLKGLNEINRINRILFEDDTFCVFYSRGWLIRGIEFKNIISSEDFSNEYEILDNVLDIEQKIRFKNLENNFLIFEKAEFTSNDKNTVHKSSLVRKNYLFEGRKLLLEEDQTTYYVSPKNYFNKNQCDEISKIFTVIFNGTEGFHDRNDSCLKSFLNDFLCFADVSDSYIKFALEYFFKKNNNDLLDSNFNSSNEEINFETDGAQSFELQDIIKSRKKHKILSDGIQNDDENEISLQHHEENKKNIPCQHDENSLKMHDETIILSKKNFNMQKNMREKNKKRFKKHKVIDKIPKKITKKFFLELCDEYENLYGNNLDENVLNSEKSNIKYNFNDKIFKDFKFKPAIKTDQIISNNMATFTNKCKNQFQKNDNVLDEIKSENEIYDSDIIDQTINEFSKKKTTKPFKQRLVSTKRKKKNFCYNKVQKLKNLKYQIDNKKMKKYNNLIYESEESCENNNFNDTSYPFNTINYDDPSSDLTNNLNESPVLENRVSTTDDILSNDDSDTTPIPSGFCCIY